MKLSKRVLSEAELARTKLKIFHAYMLSSWSLWVFCSFVELNCTLNYSFLKPKLNDNKEYNRCYCFLNYCFIRSINQIWQISHCVLCVDVLICWEYHFFSSSSGSTFVFLWCLTMEGITCNLLQRMWIPCCWYIISRTIYI